MSSPAPPLPTVEALAALWRELTAQPLWRSPNLRRYLRLRRNLRLDLLEVHRVRVLAPPGKVNDCAACTDLCCIGPKATVLLRLRDIATLVDLGRTELMTLEKPVFPDEEQRARPALQRHLASEAWRRFPVLRQTKLRACVALSMAGQCTLYPQWPLSCARFPYALHSDSREAFYSPRCDSYWIRLNAVPKARVMLEAAVCSYNERIKDAVLLAYAPQRLAELGLTRFLADDPVIPEIR